MTDHPITFKAGPWHYVTDPTADPSRLRGTIRRARLRAWVGRILFLGAGGVVLLALLGVFELSAVAVGLGIGWLSHLLDEHHETADARRLDRVASVHAGTAETLRALDGARDPARAHAALYAAAGHAQAARACEVKAERLRSGPGDRGHQADVDELVAESSRQRLLARQSLNDAHAACVDGPAVPWAQRYASNAMPKPRHPF